MKLVIAEKPSVAGEIAKVIGATKRDNGYFSGNGYYVSWCVGHLIQSAMPEDYDPSLKRWSLDTLPFVPKEWKTVVSENTKTQYEILSKLMKNSEVQELVCATDAGREGELIFRLVYEKTGCQKPFKRLWISSMETTAIQNGIQSMKDGKEYDNLYKAALSRMNADFLVGINATRLYSCMYNKKLNIGRVQSPTINLIVKRQRSIESFQPVPYYILTADCGNFKAHARYNFPEKTIDDMEKSIKNIVDKCNGKTGTVTSIEKEEKKENAAPLFDLTSLQREANKLLGYSAQQTLDVVQSLYEAKLTTYPRTDSRYLTDDMEASTLSLIEQLATSKILDTKTLNSYDTKNVNIKRVINNEKVTDHHAIIPTQSVLKVDLEKLPTAEKNILLLITYRLLTSIYTPQKYTQTKLSLDIEGEEFISTGKQILEEGFKEYQNNMIEILKAKPEKEDKDTPENEVIPSTVVKGLKVEKVKVTKAAKKTKPMQPFTEATLLAAMESAGKDLEDQELKEAMKDSGLGTPATRAGIIERIIKTGFIERKGKQLYATQQAYTLMDLLPEKLKEPEMTAEWEHKLELINRGELSKDRFMGDITAFIQNIIQESKNQNTPEKSKDTFREEKESLGKCPRCGKNVVELPKTYSCETGKEGCGFSIWKDDKFFKDKKKALTKKQVSELLKTGKVKMTGLYSAAKDKNYDATVVLDDTGKYVNFKLEFDNTKK